MKKPQLQAKSRYTLPQSVKNSRPATSSKPVQPLFEFYNGSLTDSINELIKMIPNSFQRMPGKKKVISSINLCKEQNYSQLKYVKVEKADKIDQSAQGLEQGDLQAYC